MNFERLKLRHLRCLVMVGQERNLLRAAKALALSQPAVSKTIAELEDIVGRQLLVRRRRGVDLTPAGEVLMRHCASTLRGLRDGLSQALEQGDGETLQVAVGAMPNTAVGLLPQAVVLLADAHPSLRVRVLSGGNAQLMRLLRQGEADLVLGRQAEASVLAGLQFKELYREPFLLVVRPGHPLVCTGVFPPSALSAFPMLVPAQDSLARDTVDAYLYAQEIALSRTIVETTDTGFALCLLRRTDAIWFAPQGAVAAALARGEIACLALDTGSTEGAVGVTVRRSGDPGEGARQLIAAIEQVLRERGPARALADVL